LSKAKSNGLKNGASGEEHKTKENGSSPASSKSSKQIDSSKLGANNGEYRGDYVSVFHLVTHTTRRLTEDRFHKIVMALFLLHSLQKTSYFSQFHDKDQGEVRFTLYKVL